MLSETDLSELILTKLCHDLAGPIGAIQNGLEYIQDQNSTLYENGMGLVVSSANYATARMQFYRQLFGVSSHHSDVQLNHLRQLTLHFLQGGKIRLHWPEIQDESIYRYTPRFTKLILNAIYLCASILIQGGDLHVKLFSHLPGQRAVITGQGNRVRLAHEAELLLTTPLPDITLAHISSRHVQPFYTRLLARQLRAKFDYQVKEQSVEITVETLPNT
jgi:histidine phosphotransferase ChpT